MLFVSYCLSHLLVCLKHLNPSDVSGMTAQKWIAVKMRISPWRDQTVPTRYMSDYIFFVDRGVVCSFQGPNLLNSIVLRAFLFVFQPSLIMFGLIHGPKSKFFGCPVCEYHVKPKFISWLNWYLIEPFIFLERLPKTLFLLDTFCCTDKKNLPWTETEMSRYLTTGCKADVAVIQSSVWGHKPFSVCVLIALGKHLQASGVTAYIIFFSLPTQSSSSLYIHVNNFCSVLVKLETGFFFFPCSQ